MIAKWQRVNLETSEVQYKVLVRAAEVFGKDESWVIEMLNKKLIKTEHRMIVEIDWSEQELQGVVSYHLAALSYLRKLDHSGNEISPSSAKEVADLQARLRDNFIVDAQDKITLKLTMSSNVDWQNAGFEGEVPDELLSLPNLRKINLKGNSLMIARMTPLIEGLRNELGSSFICDPPSQE
ncbi:hypothetical protein TL16_g02905 [Triparma laevis f. inornata]|uniref:Uncharacterized protein n=1 Tax=Triparma laevis f. inornata TaxID=1714386 RepID=A0A9W6ZUH7_9STRA|nr:hypothetical protein TL16_g02905 [Triparma laevis f. inornata]